MGALAQLSDTELQVDPGKSVSVTVTVRNTGSVVDQFTLEVLGNAAPWASVDPPSVNLFPDSSGTATVSFAPPRDPSVAAGTVPFGIRVISREDPDGSVVEEGTLAIGAFSDLGIEVLPKIATGRFSAHARVAIDNRSNCPYQGELSGTDPRQGLSFGFRPAIVDIPSGAAVFSRVRLKPSKRHWRGSPVTHTFSVVSTAAAPAEDEAAVHKPTISADGSMVQDTILPHWLFRAVLGLALLAALFAILWFTLFKPQIHSTAQDQVAKQLAAAGIVSGTTTPTTSSASSSNTTSPSATKPTVATTPTTSPASATFTINGSYTATGNGTKTFYTIPSGRSLNITDMVVQNANGSAGTLSLASNGTVLIQWALDTFRDLDYHWITPIVFGSGTNAQVIISGCKGTCSAGIYYAGTLSKS